MASNQLVKQPVIVLRTAFNALITQPAIAFPFFLIFCFQLLILEILYFAPRYPLVHLFGPLIARLSGEQFLHYPYNIVLLVQWFQKLQIPLYIVVSSYCIGAAVLCINDFNAGHPVRMASIFKRTVKRYVHLFVATALMCGMVVIMAQGYGNIMERATHIQSTGGRLFLLKQMILIGAPYVHLLISVIVSIMFAFVIPIIMLEDRSVFTAIYHNFIQLWRGGDVVMWLVLLPSVLMVPVLLLRSTMVSVTQMSNPDMLAVFTVITTAAVVFIDALQYTAITTFYILRKEQL